MSTTPRLIARRRRRSGRATGVVAAFLMLAALLSFSPLAAQSQNEVLTTVLFDGTAGFDSGEPTAASGSAPEPHTPSLDGGPQNLVVRTHDQFSVRVDWNVNEAAATGVVLTVVLPSHSTWAPDVTGMFAGCNPATSSFPDPQTLECHLLDQTEGSNGAIRPVAFLHEALDNTTFDVVATLTTDADPAGVSDGLDQELTVSEAPYVDYVKSAPMTSPLLNNGTEDGYVLFYPLTMVDFSQSAPLKGTGPINDAVDVQLYDHMWNLTPGVRVATPAEMAAASLSGPACGNYHAANGGAFVDGSLPTSGTWTCGAPTSGAGGYPVVPVNIGGFTSRPAAATLSNGGVNGPAGSAPIQVTSGQIAIWVSAAEVQDAIDDPENPIPPDVGSTAEAKFDNSLVEQDQSFTISSVDDVGEAAGQGMSGPAVQGDSTNNTAPVGFGTPASSPPGPGVLTGHDIKWEAGPLQLLETTLVSNGTVLRTSDTAPTTEGGPGTVGSFAFHADTAGAASIGDVARGQVLTLRADASASASADGSSLALHQCVALDTTHYNVVDLPASVLVRQGTDDSYWVTTTGYSSTSPSDGIAHVEMGDQLSRLHPRIWSGGVANDDEPRWAYIVEVTDAPLPVSAVTGGTGVDEDALTCDGSDAGPSGWVASTADLSVFDTVTAGDGAYEGITRVRLRSLEPVDAFSSDAIEAADNRWDGIATHLMLNVQVKQDLAVNSDNQELFAFTSHAFTATGWDGVAAPVLSTTRGDTGGSCIPHSSNWNSDDPSGDGYVSPTGWCGNRFHDDGANSFDTADNVDWPLHTTVERIYHSQWYGRGSGTVARIVGVKPGLKKENLDGTNDVKDNGQLVQFKITPSTTGATVEALTNYVVTDNLPSHFQFVRFVDLPDVPYVDESSGQNIRIRYSDATPDADPALPAGLAGGWPASTGLDASFTIEVRVTGAIADPESPTVLPNSASVGTSGLGPWDPVNGEFATAPVATNQSASASAFSYMPLPSDEGVILKAVDTLAGPCVLHPDVDPPTAGWDGRCSMIGYDDEMSFLLSFTNEGNTAFNNIEIVDVFSHNADEVEPASGTNVQGGSPSTLGDGRTPDSDFAGGLSFVSMAPASLPGTLAATTWVTGDDPATISRDPAVTVGQGSNVWCDAPGGTVQSGTGTCPPTAADVTAIYTIIASTSTNSQNWLKPGQTLQMRLTLDPAGHECDDIWTNTFGLRTPEILLPIRSNDVSIMVECQFDLALEKTIDPAFVPGADWVTEGSTTVDFLIEVTNQGDRVEDFEVTDYVDTDVFTFVAGNNPDGTTTGDEALAYTWNSTDPAKPVVSLDGALENGESVTIPVTLTIEDAGGPFENWAEISYFDSDGDPSNGDSDPTNPNNPSTGELVDEDSTPDDDQAGDNQPTGAGAAGDGVITGDGDGSDPVADDEDDHDVAGIPVYDLELVKVARDPGVDVSTSPWHATFDITVSNQGSAEVFLVDVTEYPPTGLALDAAATAALWTAEGLTGLSQAGSTFTIAGPIAAGGSVTFPVVFDITDLTAAPYVNAAEISAFDSNADPNDSPDPLAVDVDSTPDAVDDDDRIDHTESGYDPDADGDVNEATAGDEDDHDIAELGLPIDLALQKRIDPSDPDLLDGVRNGDELTFFIEVFNQAGPVEDFHVTDYVSDAWVFDPALNAAGVTTGDQALPFVWDATDLTKPTAMVDGVLDTFESVVIPVVLTVNIDDVGDGLYNYAEISYFDDDGDPSNGDSDPDNPNNPVDGPLADIDSTPDQTQGDPMVDDVVDGSGGDEDDHDQAFTKWWDLELIKTRSVGQDYVIDPAAVPLEVSFDITVNNQGPEDAVDVAVTDTPPAGFTYARMTDTSGTISTSGANDFTISALASGDQVTFTVVYTIDLATVAVPAVNVAEISAMEGEWDPDGPLGPLPFGTYPVADIDSVPNSDPTDDPITTDGVVDPADSHNTLDNDADGDGNLHDVDGLDEDDHDSEAISLPYDLALAKTFVSADAPLVPGGDVTMLITVTNQGPAVEQIDIVDYLDPAMWQAFDAALNPDGAVDASSTAIGFGFSWDATDPQNPIAAITSDTPGDKIGFGETIAIPVTVTVVEGADTSKPLVNVAEIARFDNDGDPGNGDSDPDNPDNPATGPLLDGDSTPDTTNESGPGETIGADLVDDSITGDGQAGNDEDDHDPVIIPVMDLALRKTLHPDTVFPIVPGGQVSFLIEVINQGSTHATGITVTDYVDPAMWAGFDLAWNPSAATTGDAVLPYSWAVNANGQDGDLAINGILAPGETVLLAVTFTIAPNADLEALVNTAEISSATASDATGAEVLNPDGSTIVDIDSTPDTNNGDPLVDDVIDGSDGDEDDHDIALVTPPTYSLGNQVWADLDNDGQLDADEDPIEGVVVHLFTDEDGDGRPDDRNGDDVIDAADAIATDTTGPDGDYLFTDLAAGEYVVGIAPENWDEDGPLDDWVSSGPTSTDPNDDIDNNDDGTPDPNTGYVLSGPVSLDDGEPTDEPGLDNDLNTPDALSNLTVDFGFHKPVYDLALEKTVATGQSTTGLRIGDDVTFTIAVFNQGTVAATDITVIDYMPEGMELNDPDWTENGDDTASITLTGVTIAAAASTTVDVTMTITAAGNLENHAEITGSTPIGDNGEPLTEPDGTTIDDIDSTPDAENSDVLADGITNTDATGGDEDDHDVAGITVLGPTSGAPPTIAFTGRESNTPAGIAVGMICIGLLLVLWERRRQQLEIVES